MSEPIALTAAGLRIEFWRSADRYRHEVVARGDGPDHRLLASIEGSAEEEWPASPPLQELHVEQRGAGKWVALLVGRAGRSHWSLSVEGAESEPTLLFDVACRSAGAGDELTSRYRLAEGGMLSSNDGLIALPSCHRLEVVEGVVHRTGADSSFDIRPLRERSGGGRVQTFRWRYRIGPLTDLESELERA
ncbi:MAG TPA: hypothetical protein VHC22_31085 [Pirellulales bacterium]|nr:hypothetical protein [Pirellulales bacterium]